MIAPAAYRWTGEAFEPLPRFRAECDRTFAIGEVLRLEPVKDRSTASHNHEFAWLKQAWMTLPEDISDDYPSPDHLRKRALIEAGFFDEIATDAGTAAAAVRVCAAMKAMDDFAHVFVRGPYVIRRTAKSQSRRAMGAKEFQDSKSKIMDVIAEMLGTTAGELAKQAEAA